MCYVNECCCGCCSLHVGVITWAIIDALIVVYLLVDGVQKSGLLGFHLCWIVVGIADVLLVYGVAKPKVLLIKIWLVIYAISIVGDVIAVGTVVYALKYTKDVVNEGIDFDALCKGKPNCPQEEASVGSDFKLALVAVLVMALIYTVISIYFWIVVNSLRKKISDGTVLPVSQPRAIKVKNYPKARY